MNARRNVKYGNVKKGPALDLSDGNYYASGWERDTARFLNLLVSQGVIDGFEYEPQDFSFQNQGYKNGVMAYRPDFVLRYCKDIPKDWHSAVSQVFDVKPGQVVYLEVKGQETSKDRTKWKRFRKLGYNLDVIKRDKMYTMQELFSQLIPQWESKVRA